MKNNFRENTYCPSPIYFLNFSRNDMESQENYSRMNLSGQVLLSSDLRKETFVYFFGAYLFGKFLKTH